MGPTLSDPIPELIIIFRCGSDPIRSKAGACTPSTGMYSILSDPIPEFVHPLPGWIRYYLIRYRGLHIILRCGSDPTRSDTGAYTFSPGMYPILSDPIPEPMHPLPTWIRPDPTRYRSLYILSRNGFDSIRSDTGVVVHYLPVRIRSYHGICRAAPSTIRKLQRWFPRCEHYLLRASEGLAPHLHLNPTTHH